MCDSATPPLSICTTQGMLVLTKLNSRKHEPHFLPHKPNGFSTTMCIHQHSRTELTNKRLSPNERARLLARLHCQAHARPTAKRPWRNLNLPDTVTCLQATTTHAASQLPDASANTCSQHKHNCMQLKASAKRSDKHENDLVKSTKCSLFQRHCPCSCPQPQPSLGLHALWLMQATTSQTNQGDSPCMPRGTAPMLKATLIKQRIHPLCPDDSTGRPKLPTNHALKGHTCRSLQQMRLQRTLPTKPPTLIANSCCHSH